jgi:hypothetical protein
VPSEKQFAKNVLKAKKLRVILHLEQPQKPSKLFPKVVDPAHIKDRLKQLLKAIDAHPQVIDKSCLKPEMCWQVVDSFNA